MQEAGEKIVGPNLPCSMHTWSCCTLGLSAGIITVLVVEVRDPETSVTPPSPTPHIQSISRYCQFCLTICISITQIQDGVLSFLGYSCVYFGLLGFLSISFSHCSQMVIQSYPPFLAPTL